jgi:hypothetical protein
MDFTKGEILELNLRLIAFSADSGPLIAGVPRLRAEPAIVIADGTAKFFRFPGSAARR